MNARAAVETVHDYVVVGGGSAGSAIASRLSESGRFSVLLLEAGEDDPWIWLRVPLGAGFVLLSQRSLWRFHTEPQANLANRKMFWPRGRVLGGSSTINGMLWVRGEPAEFDHWRALGNPGWGYDDVLPFLNRVESYAKGDEVVRGKHGPVHISLFGRNALGDAFHKACVQAGVPATPDYNGAQYEGVGYLQSNTKRGLRFGGREAYLRPARGRSNLRVRTSARADRIRVEKGRAVGVEYRIGGERKFARAAREVIVSAGAVQSPQLLELSGIGDKERLAEFGIASVAHLPGVGENCRDHLHTRVSFECTRPITLNDILDNPLRKAWMGLRYLVRRDGEMAACTATVHALAKTDPSLDRPDVKIQMHNLSAEDPRHPTELVLDRFPGFGIGTFALRPEFKRVRPHPFGRSRRSADDRGQLPDRRARPQDERCRAPARAAHCRAAGAGQADRARGAPRPRSAVRRGAARAHRQARRHLLPPHRHLQDGQRRHGRGGPRAARAWRHGPAHRRRLHHADHGLLQHERALLPDR